MKFDWLKYFDLAMNNLCRLCLEFSNDMFQTCLEIETKHIQSSQYIIPEILKQILLSNKTIFCEAVKAEKSETNLEYAEVLEAIVKNIQGIIYWLGLLKNKDFIDNYKFEYLNKNAEEIRFIAQSTIQKIDDFMHNPDFYINYDEL